MVGELVVMLAVGLFAGLWFTATVLARSGKRRDAERLARVEQPRRRRSPWTLS